MVGQKNDALASLGCLSGARGCVNQLWMWSFLLDLPLGSVPNRFSPPDPQAGSVSALRCTMEGTGQD